jgi:hypothetical protein
MMLPTIWRTFITLFAAIVYAQAQTRTTCRPVSRCWLRYPLPPGAQLDTPLT